MSSLVKDMSSKIWLLFSIIGNQLIGYLSIFRKQLKIGNLLVFFLFFLVFTVIHSCKNSNPIDVVKENAVSEGDANNYKIEDL